MSNASPAFGTSINYVLSVTNASGSALTATGVTVQDTLPAGFAFTGASGFGSYNSATGVWTVGSIPAGTTRTLTISGTVTATAGATVTNVAEVSASSASDFDSTPGNGAAGEDDYDTASFTVSGTRVAGTPPTLVCPVGSTVHDWDSVSWPAGTTSGSYALTAIGTMNFDIGISGGVFLNNATYGGQSPTRQNIVTGGFSPAQFSIFQIADFTSQAGCDHHDHDLADRGPRRAVPRLRHRLCRGPVRRPADRDRQLQRCAGHPDADQRRSATMSSATAPMAT